MPNAETRRYVSLETDSRATVENFCLLGLVFRYGTVSILSIVDENTRDPSLSLCVSHDVYQVCGRLSQSIKEYEFDDYIFASATKTSGKTTIEFRMSLRRIA